MLSKHLLLQQCLLPKMSQMLMRGELFIRHIYDVVGHYEIKPPIYEKFMKNKKCICTNGMLENGLMYLYKAFSLM